MDSNTFTVLPMSQRFYLEAGKTYEGSISIVNPADATGNFLYKIEVLPYGVVGEDYNADFTSVSGHTEIVKWIEVLEPTGAVKPNDTKQIDFVIRVPENAPPGGQYAAIAVSSNAKAESSGGLAVNNVFELASLVYANVAGETTYGGEILSNEVPGFVVTPPIKIGALISNEGNTHQDATFVINVSNFFTGEVILPNGENEGRYSELIMPESSRYVLRDVSNLPAIGIIKVNQTIYYNGDVSTIEKNVIICPIWFMALVILTILAIIAAIIGIIKKHKRKKAVI